MSSKIRFRVKLNKLILMPIIIFTSILVLPAISAMAIPYGYGTYGTCTYNTCGISLTSSNNISVDVTPSDSYGNCSISNDQVSVLTDSSTGYSLTLSTNSSSNSLTNGHSYITSTSGTYSSPSTLSQNQWGYRIDGQGGFGSGPTTTITNNTYPISKTFAGAPPNTLPPTTVVTSLGSANPAVITKVWYGVCANTSLTPGLYTGQVLYSATTN
jgi:hypothetical protein